jgi:mannose-6-phosphate isomerase-like protein (cupin superfamily)
MRQGWPNGIIFLHPRTSSLPAQRSRKILMDNNRTPYAPGSERRRGGVLGLRSLWTVKASAEQTGGRFSLIEELAPGGAATPLHVHREDDETFYVLEGELRSTSMTTSL